MGEGWWCPFGGQSGFLMSFVLLWFHRDLWAAWLRVPLEGTSTHWSFSSPGPKLSGVECLEGMAAGLYEELFAAVVMLVNRWAPLWHPRWGGGNNPSNG